MFLSVLLINNKVLTIKTEAPVICQNQRNTWRSLRHNREVTGGSVEFLKMSKDLIQARGTSIAQEKEEEIILTL